MRPAIMKTHGHYQTFHRACKHIKNNMKKLTWMDSPSKTAALEKFNKMKFKIGYPNYYDDDVTKLQRYMNYQVDMNDFYSNIERSTKLKVRLRMVYLDNIELIV